MNPLVIAALVKGKAGKALPDKGAGRAVTYAMLGSGLVTVGASLSKGGLPEPYVVMGGAGVFIILGVMADIAPDLAKALALLVFVSILLAFADDLFKALDQGLSNAQTDKATKAKTKQGGRKSGYSKGGLPGPGSPNDPRIQSKKKKGKK
jgi:hypothetical protein